MVVAKPIADLAPKPPAANLCVIDKVLSNQLTEDEARQFGASAPEIVAFTLLALQQRLLQTQQATGPNTPSAAIPPDAKPNVKSKAAKKGDKKRGGQLGHPGTTRDPLPEPDRTREHQCEQCPDCGGELTRTTETRRRRSEDIPEDLKPVITEDILHRDYCPHCQICFSSPSVCMPGRDTH